MGVVRKTYILVLLMVCACSGADLDREIGKLKIEASGMNEGHVIN